MSISGATAAMQEFMLMGNSRTSSKENSTKKTNNARDNTRDKLPENTEVRSITTSIYLNDHHTLEDPTCAKSQPTTKEKEKTSNPISTCEAEFLRKSREISIYSNTDTLPSILCDHYDNHTDMMRSTSFTLSAGREASPRQPRPISFDAGPFYTTHKFEGVAMTVPFSVIVTLATRYNYQHIYKDVVGTGNEITIEGKQKEAEEVTMCVLRYLIRKCTELETDDIDEKNNKDNVNSRFSTKYGPETINTHKDVSSNIPLMSDKGLSDLKAEVYKRCIESVLKVQGESVFSPFCPESELFRINNGMNENSKRTRNSDNGVVTDEHQLSEDMYKVLHLSDELNKATGGLFDPTVMTLNRRYSRITGEDIAVLDDHREKKEFTEKQLMRNTVDKDKMKDTFGWSKRIHLQAPIISDCPGSAFMLNTEPPKMFITHSTHYKEGNDHHRKASPTSPSPSFKTHLDLCAISKGYVIDCIHKKFLGFTHEIKVKHQLSSVDAAGCLGDLSADVTLSTHIYSHSVNLGGDILVHGRQPVRVQGVPRNVITASVRMLCTHKNIHCGSPPPFTDGAVGDVFGHSPEGDRIGSPGNTIDTYSCSFDGCGIDERHNTIDLEQHTVEWRPWKVSVLWPVGQSQYKLDTREINTGNPKLQPDQTGLTVEFSDGNEYMTLDESTISHHDSNNVNDDDLLSSRNGGANANAISICTSDINGGHIIDPSTCSPVIQYRPVSNVFTPSECERCDTIGKDYMTDIGDSPVIVSVTVVSENSSAEADGLATAVLLYRTVAKAEKFFKSWMSTRRSTIFTHTLTGTNSVTNLTKERHKSLFFTGLKRVIVIDSEGLLSILYDIRPESRTIHVAGNPPHGKKSIVSFYRSDENKEIISIDRHQSSDCVSSQSYLHSLKYNYSNSDNIMHKSDMHMSDIIRKVGNPKEVFSCPSAARLIKGSEFLQSLSRFFVRRTVSFLFVKCSANYGDSDKTNRLNQNSEKLLSSCTGNSSPKDRNVKLSGSSTYTGDSNYTKYIGVVVSSLASMDPTTAAIFLEKHSLAAHNFEQLYNKNQLLSTSGTNKGPPDIFIMFPHVTEPTLLSSPGVDKRSTEADSILDILLEMFTTPTVIEVRCGKGTYSGDDDQRKSSPTVTGGVSHNMGMPRECLAPISPLVTNSNINPLLEAIVNSFTVRGYTLPKGMEVLNDTLYRNVVVIPCNIIAVVPPQPMDEELHRYTVKMTILTSRLGREAETSKDTNSPLFSSRSTSVHPTVFGLGDHYIGVVSWAGFQCASFSNLGTTRFGSPITPFSSLNLECNLSNSTRPWISREREDDTEGVSPYRGHIPYVPCYNNVGTGSGSSPGSEKATLAKTLYHSNSMHVSGFETRLSKSAPENEARLLKLRSLTAQNLNNATVTGSAAQHEVSTPRVTPEQLKNLKALKEDSECCDEGTFLFFFVQRVGVQYISSMLKQRLSFCDVIHTHKSPEKSPNMSFLHASYMSKGRSANQSIKQLHFAFDSGISAVGVFSSVFGTLALQETSPQGYWRTNVGVTSVGNNKVRLTDLEVPLSGTDHRNPSYRYAPNVSKDTVPKIFGVTLHSVDINNKGDNPYITAVCNAGPLTQKILFGLENRRQNKAAVQQSGNKDSVVQSDSTSDRCNSRSPLLMPISSYTVVGYSVHVKGYQYVHSKMLKDKTQIHEKGSNNSFRHQTTNVVSPNPFTSSLDESVSQSPFTTSYADNNQWHNVYGGVTVRLCFFAQEKEYTVIGGDNKKRCNKHGDPGDDGKGQLLLFSDISSAALTTEENFRLSPMPRYDMTEEFTTQSVSQKVEDDGKLASDSLCNSALDQNAELPMIQFLDPSFLLDHTVAAVDCIVESVLEVTTETTVTKQHPCARHKSPKSPLKRRDSNELKSGSRIGTPTTSYMLKLIPIRTIKELPPPYRKDGSTTILL